MTLGEAIVQTLAADVDLTQLVEDRVYPIRPPKDAELPNIIYQRITATPATTHNEPAQSQHDLVQFTISAGTYEECEAVAVALKAALDDKAVGDRGRAMFEDERDVDSPLPELFACSLDFLI